MTINTTMSVKTLKAHVQIIKEPYRKKKCPQIFKMGS